MDKNGTAAITVTTEYQLEIHKHTMSQKMHNQNKRSHYGESAAPHAYPDCTVLRVFVVHFPLARHTAHTLMHTVSHGHRSSNVEGQSTICIFSILPPLGTAGQ